MQYYSILLFKTNKKGINLKKEIATFSLMQSYFKKGIQYIPKSKPHAPFGEDGSDFFIHEGHNVAIVMDGVGGGGSPHTKSFVDNVVDVLGKKVKEQIDKIKVAKTSLETTPTLLADAFLETCREFQTNESLVADTFSVTRDEDSFYNQSLILPLEYYQTISRFKFSNKSLKENLEIFIKSFKSQKDEYYALHEPLVEFELNFEAIQLLEDLDDTDKNSLTDLFESLRNLKEYENAVSREHIAFYLADNANTTLTLALQNRDHLMTMNVGDSGLILFENGKVKFRTKETENEDCKERASQSMPLQFSLEEMKLIDRVRELNEEREYHDKLTSQQIIHLVLTRTAEKEITIADFFPETEELRPESCYNFMAYSDGYSDNGFKNWRELETKPLADILDEYITHQGQWHASCETTPWIFEQLTRLSNDWVSIFKENYPVVKDILENIATLNSFRDKLKEELYLAKPDDVTLIKWGRDVISVASPKKESHNPEGGAPSPNKAKRRKTTKRAKTEK